MFLYILFEVKVIFNVPLYLGEIVDFSYELYNTILRAVRPHLI